MSHVHNEALLRAHRERLAEQLGDVEAEGDIAAAIARLRPLLEESETIQIGFDPEFDHASVSIGSPYSSTLGAFYQARSITAALDKAIAARRAGQ